MSTHPSPALPIAYVVLRILIVLNWLMGAAIVALLVVAEPLKRMGKFTFADALDSRFDDGPFTSGHGLISGLDGRSRCAG